MVVRSDWRPFAVGVGTNVGDRLAQAGQAMSMLAIGGGFRHLHLAAPISTDAVVPEPHADSHPRYLNTAIVGETTWSPSVMMGRLLAIEAACGRRRRGTVDPRTLDLDLLVLGLEHRRQPGLDLPHPRLDGREFVLAPLRSLLERLDRGADVGGRAVAEGVRKALEAAGVVIRGEARTREQGLR